MNYNDKFFNYEPTAIGVVIDSANPEVVKAIKNALIGLIKDLDNDEDKMFVYGKKYRIEFPESLGTSVSELCDYQEPKDFSLDLALNLTLDVLGDMEDEYKRVLLYFTDRQAESHPRRVDRAMVANSTYLFETIKVFDLGTESNVLKEVCQKHEAGFYRVSASELTTELIKKAIDGKG